MLVARVRTIQDDLPRKRLRILSGLARVRAMLYFMRVHTRLHTITERQFYKV